MTLTKPTFDPLSDPSAIVLAPSARFTILASRLIRLEYSPDDGFEDRPSQAFWYRRQPTPAYEVSKESGIIEIETSHLRLRYTHNPDGFTSQSLTIDLKENGVRWHYGDSNQDGGNLLGTTRTLDETSGAVQLEAGLMARHGWSLIDDSNSLVFTQDGWLEPRQNPKNLDLYFFGYGHAYLDCLKDYYKITGKPPLIPRWALGNWWSRYWNYTQDELEALVEEFEANQAPLSVCIIDMDWHLEGWTGYTWNRDLFPDPKAFIAWLHTKGLKTALNLHPANGVGPHEAQYAQMAAYMDLDPDSEERIPFDCAAPKFMQAYFQILHHPKEEDGIDFWWVDWQQGTQTKLPGLDPLWWLNHLHFYDLGRDGSKRPFTFSRWGGLGNHRYPIGFSGDTLVTWKALDFQPYFTATAANVGYGWWSHDIGGHMGGVEDDELYTRWVQYGVFSPILRLHSTKNPFHERRPWGRGPAAAQAAGQALRLRHALIPYIYSMAWRDHDRGIPLVTPLYYSHPEEEAAYHCPQAYWFGNQLVAAPFTSPADPQVGLCRQFVWLPALDGEQNQGWYDFFNGEFHPGGKWQVVYGGVEDIPVFARAGAIVPLGPQVGWGGVSAPDVLTLHIFPGADNRFELYEDDGETTAYQDGQYALTTFTQTWEGNRLEFAIEPTAGDTSLAPPTRRYNLLVRSIHPPEVINLTINGTQHACPSQYDPVTEILHLTPSALTPRDSLALILSTSHESLLSKRDRRAENTRRLLDAFHLDTYIKARIDHQLPELLSRPQKLKTFKKLLTEAQYTALSDTLR